MHLEEHVILFNLIYQIPICGKYYLEGCLFGQIWKNFHFSGRLRLDWGITSWAAMAGLGSIGLRIDNGGLALISLRLTFLPIAS